MRFTPAIIAAAITAGWIHSWLAAIIAGAVIFAVTQPRNQDKRVMVEDLRTGKITIQPNDSTTQRFLNSRKDQ